MKTFALAATVAAGLLCTAGSADAQYRSRGFSSYSTPNSYAPSYNYSYSSPLYSVPTYNGVTSVGTYTPLGGTTIILPQQPYNSNYGSSYYNAPRYNNFNNFNGYNNYGGSYRGGRGYRW